MSRLLLRTLFTATLLSGALATTAHAQDETLFDSETFEWDIDSNGYGYIKDGGRVSPAASDSYDRWPRLCVLTDISSTASCNFSDDVYNVSETTSTLSPSGREIVMAIDVLHGLEVQRRIFVPATGVGFARYVDSFRNPTASPVLVKVRVGTTASFTGDFGSDGNTVLIATSSGDTTLTTADDWFVTDDDNDGAGDSSLASVVDGVGGAETTLLMSQPPWSSTSVDDYAWEYEMVTIPPGQRVAYMYFLIQQPNNAAATTRAMFLADAPAESLAELDPVLRFQIQNWSLGDPADCGNGTIDPGEQCDDMNDDDTDACTTRCLDARCGDGFLRDTIEECDDGNGEDADDCTNACELPVCGDGIVHTGEECDEGALNSNTMADACRMTCVAASCTDGVVDMGEMCDDGNEVDDDDCSNLCRAALCGDGIIQAARGEECDDGNAFDRDACTMMCLNARCGDAVVRLRIEECDDGNDDDDDACSNTCVANICGDGRVGGGEECDDGPDNSDTETDACRTSCQSAGCGDSIVDRGEACDDGDEDDTDGCTNLCELPTCGDGVTSTTELCDDGEANGSRVGGCNRACDGFVRTLEMDAGADTGVDAGSDAGADAGTPDGDGGCSAVGGRGSIGWLGLLVLGFLVRRRRLH